MGFTREIFEEILDSGHPLICRFEPGVTVGQLPHVVPYKDGLDYEVVYVIFYTRDGRICRTVESKQGERTSNINGYYTGNFVSMFEVVQMSRSVEVMITLLAAHPIMKYERSASILILQQKSSPEADETNINKLLNLIRAEKALSS